MARSSLKLARSRLIGTINARIDEPLRKDSVLKEAKRLYRLEPFEYRRYQDIPSPTAKGMAHFLLAKYGQKAGMTTEDLRNLGELLKLSGGNYGYRHDHHRLRRDSDMQHESRKQAAIFDRIGKPKLDELLRKLDRTILAIGMTTENSMAIVRLLESGNAGMAFGHIISRGAIRAADDADRLKELYSNYLEWKKKQGRSKYL